MRAISTERSLSAGTLSAGSLSEESSFSEEAVPSEKSKADARDERAVAEEAGVKETFLNTGPADRAEHREEAEALREEAIPAGLFRARGGLLDRFGSLFTKINFEDLLLIGIAALLLLDGNPDNDMIVIILAVLLFF